MAGEKDSDQLMGNGSNTESSRTEKVLGLNQDITRRDFLNSTLLASGGMLLNPVSPAQLLTQKASRLPDSGSDDWTGYGGVGDSYNAGAIDLCGRSKTVGGQKRF